MALFTDGPASSIEDLAAQDSQVLNVASSEGIDLTVIPLPTPERMFRMLQYDEFDVFESSSAMFLGAQLVFLPEIMLLEGSGLYRAYERGTRLSRNRLGTGPAASLPRFATGEKRAYGQHQVSEEAQPAERASPRP